MLKVNDFIENFIQNNKNEERQLYYLKQLIKGALDSYLVEFLKPEFLSGPFFEKYGLITIKDHSLRPDLKFLQENYNNMIHYEYKKMISDLIYGMCNYSEAEYSVFKYKGKNVILEILDQESKSLKFEDALIEKRGKRIESVKDSIEGFISLLQKYDKEEILRLLKNGIENIEKYKQNGFFETKNLYSSIEHPFSVCLYGTDDSSWTKVFKTKEESYEFVDKFIKKVSISSEEIYETMIFSN